MLNPDKYIQAEIGNIDTVATVALNGGDEGEKAWSLKCATSEYTPLDGDYGDVAGFSLTATGADKVFMGTIMQNGQETSSGAGTARELSGMDENDVAYMVIHCTELDATTLDIYVHSDETTGMVSPVARDFGQVQFAAIGAQYLTFTAPAGIFADDCWRVTYVITGGNTTATVTVNLYIP